MGTYPERHTAMALFKKNQPVRYERRNGERGKGTVKKSSMTATGMFVTVVCADNVPREFRPAKLKAV